MMWVITCTALLHLFGLVYNRDISHQGYAASDEAQLLRTLLGRYDKIGRGIRPVVNATKRLEVRFGMRLIQMTMDEKLQEMTTSVWIRSIWYDQFLTWDPGKYGNITHVTVPWDKVWLPDISLVNTADTSERLRPANLQVRHDGHIFWAPHRQYKSACLIDVTQYPYDTHTCEMWFQPMSLYSDHLRLMPYRRSPWDLDTYLRSYAETQEWTIISNTTRRYLNPREEAGMLLKFSRRPSLCFTLTVQRRTGYISYILMLPCVFLSLMTVIIFWMPQERPDRNILAMNLFASFMVLLLVLIDVVPPSAASVPILELYYASNITLVVVTLFCSGFSIHLQSLGEKHIPVPRFWSTLIIKFLSRITCLHERATVLLAEQHKAIHPAELNVSDLSSLVHYRSSREETEEHKTDLYKELNNIYQSQPVEWDWKKIRCIKMQWRLVAQIFDRIFFVGLLCALALSFIFFFPSFH